MCVIGHGAGVAGAPAERGSMLQRCCGFSGWYHRTVGIWLGSGTVAASGVARQARSLLVSLGCLLKRWLPGGDLLATARQHLDDGRGPLLCISSNSGGTCPLAALNSCAAASMLSCNACATRGAETLTSTVWSRSR